MYINTSHCCLQKVFVRLLTYYVLLGYGGGIECRIKIWLYATDAREYTYAVQPPSNPHTQTIHSERGGFLLPSPCPE